jgi:hypothetical protein
MSRWIQLQAPTPSGAIVTVFKNLDDCNLAAELGSGRPPTLPTREILDQLIKDMEKLQADTTADPEMKKLDQEQWAKKEPKDWTKEERERFRKVWLVFKSKHAENPAVDQPGLEDPWDLPGTQAGVHRN